ncbi:Transposon Ty3-I Gag-Pol polyprotein [Trichinella sp. T6]|nr:Transposon Ty3-I Gag-Pol polyprotein [Trichinella sp. T6]
MRMSKPKKEEASGILEIAVRGRTIAIPEHGAEKLKWLPLSLSQKVRSTFRQLPPPAWHAQESWSDIGRDIRHLVEKAYLTLSNDAKDVIGLDKSLNTLDRPELVLLVKQRNPKNIEEAVRAALEVESFMIRPCPDLLISATSQTPYNADPAKNGTLADISRLSSCWERMHLKLEEIEQRMGPFQPKQRDRLSDYVTDTSANGQRPERRTCYRCGRDGRDAITNRKDQDHGNDLMAVVDQQSSIYPSYSHCGESCAASTSWLRFPSTIQLHAEHNRRGTANQWGKCSVGGGDHSKETTSADKCHGPGLLEQGPKGTLPVAIARAEVHSREGCVPVQLLNPSGDRAEHHINTGDAKSIRQCPRGIPWHFREQMDGMLADMMNKPSTSPWTAPVVLVKKKDGNVRFCVDFQKLNLVRKKDSYPPRRIDQTIDTLARAEWFSTLDLTSGYWQRVMDLTLTGLKWKKDLVYLDDVVIFGRTFQEHLNNLAEVMQRIRQSGLKLKPVKCRVCAEELPFLSHIVSIDGHFILRTDHDNLTWLKYFQEPKGQVARWLEHLQEYDMQVVHRRGLQHNNADAMSRRPEETEDNGDHPATEMPSVAARTATNGQRMLTPAGLAVVITGKPTRWVPPNHARLSILEQLYNVIGGDHHGVKKTGEKCEGCEACARKKTPPIVNRAPMESIVVGNPIEIAVFDILGPVARSKNDNSYIMVAETVARKLVQQFVCRFGTLVKLLSDQGAQFQELSMEEAQDNDVGNVNPTGVIYLQCNRAQNHRIRTLRNYVWAPSVTPNGCSVQHELGKRNDHQQIRRRVGSPLPKRVRGCLKTQCGATDAAKTHKAVWLYCSVSKSKQNRKFMWTPWTVDTVDRAVRDYQTSQRGKLSHPEYQKPKTNPAGACQSLKAINKFDVNGNPSPSPGYTAHDCSEAVAEAKPTREIQRLRRLLRSRGAIAREHGGVMVL